MLVKAVTEEMFDNKNTSPEPEDGSEKDCKFQWLTDWQTERLTTDWRRTYVLTNGLTDWQTDGRRVQYLSEYAMRWEKRTLKNQGNFFFTSAKPFLTKWRSPKDRIEFSISFHQPGWNSDYNGNVQIFFYINTNWVFSKTISLWGQLSEPIAWLYRFD